MTKNTALQNAFIRLNNRGIVAREHWTCCCTCGSAEIYDEIDENSIGYVFYHYQDAETAGKTGKLMLAFGAFRDEYCACCIAHTIITELHKGKMKCDWDGDVNTRIQVDLWSRDRKRISEKITMDLETTSNLDADHYRLGKLFSAYKKQVEMRKWAYSVIKPHLMHWATRPGGPLYKMTSKKFQKLQIN